MLRMFTRTKKGYAMSTPVNHRTCPTCGGKGKAVKPITLESLLTADALSEAGALDRYLHCGAQGCDTAYFAKDDGRTISKHDVTVRIGTKETESPRPVCYCFGHSWESIEDELRATGESEAVASITAHCRAGEDRCPETNPQGSCCLGNVRRATQEGKEKLGIVDDGPQPAAACTTEHDCCATEAVAPADDPERPRPDMAARGGMLAAFGALIAAILSSACCWLPLALVALGLGTTSVAGFFETYRTPLLVGTFGLLGAGYYFVYFRKEKCEPGSACATPNLKLKRFNQISLSIATIFVLGFAFFPNYIGSILDATSDVPNVTATAAPRDGTFTHTFNIEGMTCEGCASNLRESIAKVPGVRGVDVSFEQKRATVTFEGDAAKTDAAIITAIASAGNYTATRVD